MSKRSEGVQATVFVCCGASCKEGKAKKVRKRLSEAVAERGLEQSLEIRPTACLKQCKHGPVVMLERGNTRFDKVKPKQVGDVLDRIVKQCRLTK